MSSTFFEDELGSSSALAPTVSSADPLFDVFWVVAVNVGAAFFVAIRPDLRGSVAGASTSETFFKGMVGVVERDLRRV